MKDKSLVTASFLFELVKVESRCQIKKWGIQDRSSFEWMTYLTEEIGELAQAISEYEYRGGSVDDVIREAVQAATLCLKIAEMYNIENNK